MTRNKTSTNAPATRYTLKLAMLGITTLLATAGCHSKSAATPENFITGLNAHFIEHSECLFPTPPRFPYETSDKELTKQFDSLIKAQLLTKTEEMSIHASRYTPTTTGARYAPRFCYGHRIVTNIDSFTPPAKASNGLPETQVTYHYDMQDVPIWAKTPEVQAAFPDMFASTNGSATGKATLAGTIAGWQVPD
jgi:hypothetical protein